ncbi:magnesium transporter [uncultured Clostridium sp.]|uniref:magnesium transporter n=1 Tax=uncultured Clostridium sp. TaxID=59620 RepID=UPI0025EC12CC|nr:magnesium transporter [uncultured Clostridium sp.]MDU4885039.1 magnesium transporter [Clostridium celatum]MDU7078306.1 magnesium transporter [Clostridium celatum]
MAQELLRVIRHNNISELSQVLQRMNSVDIAKSMEELDDKSLVVVFRLLTKDTSAEVFSYLDKESQQKIIELITDDEIKEIIENLFLDDTVDIIEELPANIVGKIISNTSLEKRQLINQFLKYEEDSAGAIMTIEFIDFKEGMTIKEAIDYTRRIGVNKESLDNCFIIDRKRRLKGIISLKDLILSDENILVSDVMETNIVSVKTFEDQEKVADLFKTYDLISMPVVDVENRLVGIITVDDIVDIIEQENTEDFQKMAAMEPSEQQYLKTPVLTLAKNRIVWLLVLMISATVTGSIIQGFEDVLQSVVILASFIPMLMDTGGNSGSQSSTLVIRGLALGEITTKDFFKVIFKEFRVSIVVATILSVVNFLRLYFFTSADFMISLTVCASLFFTVVLAKVVGGVLPIVSKKLKLDPAIMASPLITTIVDAFALVVYFGFARLLLGI